MTTYEALTITAAADEGYFVMEAATEAARGMYRPILYAGELGACIRWMADRMRRQQAVEEKA